MFKPKAYILTIFLAVASVSIVFYLYKTRISSPPAVTDASLRYAALVSSITPQPTQPFTDSLPNFTLIKTAFVPQAPEKIWDQPWQDTCEEAALLTVDYFYKNQTPSVPTIKTDLQNMLNFETELGFVKDINQSQMATISSRHLGYQSTIVTDPTIETIKKYLVRNIPVIVTANGKTLYRENKHFKSGGPWYHSLVILGYDDTKKEFFVHDVGTQFGAYFSYSYSLLMESIHDFPPEGHKENIDQGSKSVLVLVK
ncbi:MAG: C39 family peptidase [Candidatus Shapirobacteria bacterium]|jgi:hypothetical protein